jgi:hypothetical protein
MTSRIIGGPALRARLDSVIAGSPALVAAWADETRERAKASAPNARRPASRQWSTKVDGTRGGVYGAFWWIFVDRGTKKHDIKARRGKALRFEYRGKTIFAKKVTHPRMPRRPFITKAAQEAFASSGMAEMIVKLWNRRRVGSRKAFL